MSWRRVLTWKIEWDDRARKELRKLDSSVQKEILSYLRLRIMEANNPRVFGQSLSGNKAGLWRYRVGNYRVICKGSCGRTPKSVSSELRGFLKGWFQAFDVKF